jgi:hypothetical protein
LEIDLATAALAVAPEPPLYARVDLVCTTRPRVGELELELVEPELFLRVHDHAAARYASVIWDRRG